MVKNNIFFYICVLKMSHDDSAEDPDLQRTEKTAEGRTCKETAKSEIGLATLTGTHKVLKKSF